MYEEILLSEGVSEEDEIEIEVFEEEVKRQLD